MVMVVVVVVCMRVFVCVYASGGWERRGQHPSGWARVLCGVVVEVVVCVGGGSGGGVVVMVCVVWWWCVCVYLSVFMHRVVGRGVANTLADGCVAWWCGGDCVCVCVCVCVCCVVSWCRLRSH